MTEQLRASAATVEALGVSREFNGRHVISHLDLELGPGEIHALLGPNGAGKTTVLRMVAGLMTPSGGHLRVVHGDPGDREIRGLIGWAPASDRSFYLRLSGRQNLTFFGRLHGMSRPEAQELAKRWIASVGLEESGSRPVRLYSHGMVKRLVVARALMCNPKVLVIDEATHDLDPLGADQIRDLVKGSAENGATVMWATQRIGELPGFAHSVTVLDQGAVRFSGSVDDLAAQAGTKSYLVAIEGGDAADLLELPWGTLSRLGKGARWRLELLQGVSLTEVFSELAARGITVMSCAEERPDVERGFLRLTGSDS
ncbi:MAG TPA: ABC transporter ATP-binding protein [Acidimicrobiia bacterium]|nr:ABC transporter ATP-binding protein [Acidimicrobiia bacterium]